MSPSQAYVKSAIFPFGLSAVTPETLWKYVSCLLTCTIFPKEKSLHLRCPQTDLSLLPGLSKDDKPPRLLIEKGDFIYYSFQRTMSLAVFVNDNANIICYCAIFLRRFNFYKKR